MSHLLPLSTLHAAAPGVLDVVFGPDGDFRGAPTASIPVLARDRWWTIAAFTAVDGLIGGALLISADGTWPPDYESVPLSWCDLDCRIPSVAARLAGLCARALGQSQPRGWGIGDANPEWCLQSVWGTRAYNWRLNGVPYGAELPVLPKGLLTPEAFLASLTLSLAPRIALLR